MRIARVALAALFPILLMACGEEDVDPQPLEPASTEAGTGSPAELAEHIGFAEALAQIRGHHLVSLELLEAGDDKGAALHAGHPIDEILASVSSELGEHDPEIAEALATALEQGLTAVTEDKPVAEVEAAYDEAAAITERALSSVVGEDAASPSFRGSVIAALLGTAGHEYEEAVGDDGLRLLAEYQDGYAFVSEGRRLYSEIEGDVTDASAEEAEEVDEAFEFLESALPSAEPPAKLVDALEVTSAAELIGHELEETVGAAPTKESDPEEVVAEIEELLGEIVATYKAGDADAAAELAAEAYLENYEVIEAEVIEKAPDVNEELEPLLGADLRRQITAGAPVEDIEQMVARAEELLADALEAIAEH
ncbi:MAG: hypothetical protein M3285_00400 [Actinomycetota bacterium]|nr:hypothetical protein [Actinomycetota bacterium]